VVPKDASYANVASTTRIDLENDAWMSTGNSGAAEEFGFPEMTSDIEMKPNGRDLSQGYLFFSSLAAWLSSWASGEHRMSEKDGAHTSGYRELIRKRFCESSWIDSDNHAELHPRRFEKEDIGRISVIHNL
jgi:hypothetical protein